MEMLQLIIKTITNQVTLESYFQGTWIEATLAPPPATLRVKLDSALVLVSCGHSAWLQANTAGHLIYASLSIRATIISHKGKCQQ